MNDDLSNNIRIYLRNLGIPNHIKGYSYIKEAIVILCNGENLKITKELYPILASLFKTNTYCIERSIRHAIEKGWVRANVEVINEIFGYSLDINKDKPTNSEFIITITNRIKEDL